MSIIIGADLVPTKTNIDLFEAGNISALVGEELKLILESADYRIFNLEMPLTDTESPITKTGPALIAPTSAVAAYKAMNVNLLTLANNHILDHGNQGLTSTLGVLRDNYIDAIGAGKSPELAARPHIFKFSNKSVGVYACAEHEFSIVTDDTPGANPFDPLESLDHIVRLKEECDYVIVLYHGGKEHYRYPSPNLQKVCRKLVDKGANLVICQHSHCIGCEEKYKSGTIIYGQGNFIFDHSKSELWKTSLLVKVTEDFKIEYIPVMKTENTVRLAVGDMGEKILLDFRQRSEDILQEGFVKSNYQAYADGLKEFYFMKLAGIKRTFLFRAVNKLTGQRHTKKVLSKKYSEKHICNLINYLECEAHRELILSILSGKGKKKQ